MTGYRIGIDVGGTFTDLVLLRPDGSVALEKSPTTPTDQSEGVLSGIGQLADGEDIDLATMLGSYRFDRARHDNGRQRDDPDEGCVHGSACNGGLPG